MARSSALVAVATAAATSLRTSTTFTLMPIDAHSRTMDAATVLSRSLGPTAIVRSSGVPVAVDHPDVERTNPLWVKTSSAHCKQSPRPLCDELGAIVVVVVCADGDDPAGPG